MFDPLDLRNITSFGQDWGGLVGLRLVAAEPDQPEVHLRPNKLVTYKYVAMVMASAQRLGVTKIGIVGNEQFLN